MAEIARFTGGSDAIQLAFVERVYTPIDLMEYAIELHLNELSLADTAIALERFGIERAKSTIHNWVQKSDLQPESGHSPEKVALDETVIKVEGQRYWYEVDVISESCTCPDWRKRTPEGGCKHPRRVDHEIKQGRVPRPDGRLPSNS